MEINILFIWIPKCGGYSIFTLFNLNRDYINNTDSDTYNYNFNCLLNCLHMFYIFAYI